MAKDKVKDKTNDNQAEVIEKDEVSGEQDYQTLAGENAKLQEEIKELKANLENLKTQQKQLMLATKVNTLKDQEIRNEEFKKYANQKMIEESILPVLLNFERALNYKTDNVDVKNFLVGFQYIFNELKNSLAKIGLKTIDVKVGDTFDSHKCQVLEVKEIKEETKTDKDNMIIKILASGYKLHDRIISPAQVKILKLTKSEQKEK